MSRTCGILKQTKKMNGSNSNPETSCMPLTWMHTYKRQTLNIATELAVKAAEGKVEKTLEEMLPPHYLEYREVFEKKDFDTLPEQ